VNHQKCSLTDEFEQLAHKIQVFARTGKVESFSEAPTVRTSIHSLGSSRA
jgi:hypothetical protein